MQGYVSLHKEDMMKGIGVDMVKVDTVRKLMERSDSFVKHTFTEREILLSEQAVSKEEFFSGRFAVKEAVFKALAHLTEEKTFDFRIVETLKREDGSPFINIEGKLSEIMREAGVGKLLVSISTEEEYVIAFVTAE